LGVHAAAPGHGDDLDLGPPCSDLDDGLHAFAIRHDDINNNRIERGGFERLDRFVPITRSAYAIAEVAQSASYKGADDRIIVHNKHRKFTM